MLNKLMDSKFLPVIIATVAAWSFVVYWIGVSGWRYAIEWKIGISLLPIVVFIVASVVKRIIEHYIMEYRNRRRRKEIMFNIKIRRMIDRYTA